MISVETKKKEQIGNLSREGKIYITETVEVFDHDFPSLAERIAVPHTVYDQTRNEAYVTIGTSREPVNLHVIHSPLVVQRSNTTQCAGYVYLNDRWMEATVIHLDTIFLSRIYRFWQMKLALIYA